MKAQVLCIDDCPNAAEAVTEMRDVLDSVGFVDMPVETVVIRSEAEAQEFSFGGSPTFLIDGVDLFPAPRTWALACRVYTTENGLAGLPTRAALKRAIQERR